MRTIDTAVAGLPMLAALLAIADLARASPSGALLASTLPAMRRATAVASCEARAARSGEAMAAAKMADWEPVDDRSVLIWSAGSIRAHLVRLARPLPGLREAPIITLIDGDGDGTISACGRDAIVLEEDEDSDSDRASAAGIVSIRLLSVEQTAQLDRGARVPPLAAART